MKQKILFCVAPYMSLIKDHAFNEIQFGPSLIRGVLDESLFDIDCVDLNSVLAQQRSSAPVLESNDLCVLMNTHLLSQYSDMPLYFDSSIDECIRGLCGSLPEKKYDYILISLPRRSTYVTNLLVSLNFTFLLAQRLKAQTGAKVIMGGSGFKNISREMFWRHVVSQLSEEYVDFIFLDSEAAFALPELLRCLYKGVKINKGFADIAFINKKKYCKSKSALNAVKAVVARFLGASLFSGHFKRYLRKSKFTKEKDLLLNVVPDFEMSNKAAYAVNIEKTFKLSRYLPQYSSYAQKTDITIYPLQFIHGCPHFCYFCGNALRKFSFLSPVQAVDQIERVIEKNPDAKYFRFFNCQINFTPQYALSFADEVIKRKLKIWFVDSADLRNPSREVFEALRKAGCVKLWIGLETLSPRMLKLANKQLTVEDICKGVELIHKEDIWIGGNLIVGLPFEEENDIDCTLRFVRDFSGKVDAWELNMFRFYPYSPYYLFRNECGLKPLNTRTFTEENLAFEERGLRSSGERKNAAKLRYRQLLSALPEANEFLDNDYLLFYFNNNFSLNKHAIRELILKYYQGSSDDKELAGRLSQYGCGYDYGLFGKKKMRG